MNRHLKRTLILLACTLANSPAWGGTFLPIQEKQNLPSMIGFGSCGHQDKPQPILELAAQRQPDLFIYLGDNIYGDTRDMQVLKDKYAVLAAKPEFQKLVAATPLLSVWDDHDYGENDAGAEYPFKKESREIFLDAWQVPSDSPRRKADGIYGSHLFEKGGRRLQVLLLDTRTHRSPLKKRDKNTPASPESKNDYVPVTDARRTMLGRKQWRWLETELRKPADLRIIASSNQFAHEYNGWESWTNLPSEQKRMLDLIRKTRARGVVFLSGDVHWGEISRVHPPGLYPIYDITSSGITKTWPDFEPNRNRLGAVVRENHFGWLAIDWKESDPTLSFQLLDVSGAIRLEHRVRLSELTLPEWDEAAAQGKRR
jgi:alkaline phosphatase D